MIICFLRFTIRTPKKCHVGFCKAPALDLFDRNGSPSPLHWLLQIALICASPIIDHRIHCFLSAASASSVSKAHKKKAKRATCAFLLAAQTISHFFVTQRLLPYDGKLHQSLLHSPPKWRSFTLSVRLNTCKLGQPHLRQRGLEKGTAKDR